MNEILIAIIIVVILLLILMLILTFMVKRINSMLKKIYVDKLQEYDFLINDKEERAIKLDDEITEKEKYFEGLKNKIDSYDIKDNITSSNEEVILPSETDYEDENILEGYKKIRDYFSFNTRGIIIDFVKRHKSDNSETYLILSGIRKYFTFKTMYKISSYQPEEQRMIVNNLLNDNERVVVDKLLKKKKFNVEGFVKKLDDLIMKSSPIVKVYVGSKKENYNDIENVETIYDKMIVEGFKIEYKGKLYDFSI